MGDSKCDLNFLSRAQVSRPLSAMMAPEQGGSSPAEDMNVGTTPVGVTPVGEDLPKTPEQLDEVEGAVSEEKTEGVADEGETAAEATAEETEVQLVAVTKETKTERLVLGRKKGETKALAEGGTQNNVAKKKGDKKYVAPQAPRVGASGGGEEKPKSWTAVVQSTPKPTMKQYDVAVEVEDGAETLILPDCVFGGVPIWEDCIIGRFTEKAPHVGAIHLTVNKIWPLGDKNVKVEVFVVNETTVKFRINDVGVRTRVLKRKMWSIKNIPMVVDKWSPNVEEAQPALKSIPMWVVLRNVPQSLYSWEGLSGLTSYFGVPRQLHSETIWCKNFEEARILVDVNLSKTLPKAYNVPLKTGEKVTVTYEFPWLPPRCTLCSKWGHEKSDCLAVPGTLTILVREPSASQIVGNANSNATGALPATVMGPDVMPMSLVTGGDKPRKSLDRGPSASKKQDIALSKTTGARPASDLNSNDSSVGIKGVGDSNSSLVREPSGLGEHTVDALSNTTGAQPACVKSCDKTTFSTGVESDPDTMVDVADPLALGEKDLTKCVLLDVGRSVTQGNDESSLAIVKSADTPWKEVSPKRAARVSQVDDGDDLSLSAGSRYSSLADDDVIDDDDEEEILDEEFFVDDFVSSTAGKNSLREYKVETIQRSSLPRQSKSNHKVVRDASYYLESSKTRDDKKKTAANKQSEKTRNSGSKQNKKKKGSAKNLH